MVRDKHRYLVERIGDREGARKKRRKTLVTRVAALFMSASLVLPASTAFASPTVSQDEAITTSETAFSAEPDEAIADSETAFSAQPDEVVSLGVAAPSDRTVEIVASGAEDFNNQSVSWTLDSAGVLRLEGEGTLFVYDGDLRSVFMDTEQGNLCDRITKIVVGEGLTGIYLWTGVEGMCMLPNLASVEFPESLEWLAGFSDCPLLEDIVLPESVHLNSVGADSFRNTPWIEKNKEQMQASYAMLGGVVFSGSESTGDIVIPEGAEVIATTAFSGCTGLTSVFLPDGLRSIGSQAFLGCSSLAEVRFPDSLESIDMQAFSECGSLKEASFPDGLSGIGMYAFQNCSSLVAVHLPESLESIDGGIFMGCSSLAAIQIPRGVKTIGGSAFSGCRALEEVIVPEDAQLETVSGTAFQNTAWKDRKIEENEPTIFGTILFDGTYCVGDVVIPEGVTEIRENAFSGTSITSVRFPDSLKTIGDKAFYGCIQLSKVHFPQSLEQLGKQAFYSCISLAEVTWDEGIHLTSGETLFKPFDSTPWQNRIVISDELVIIGDCAFLGQHCNGEVFVPEGVRSIAQSCFVWSGVTMVHLPKTVEKIGKQAFNGTVTLIPVSVDPENPYFSSVDGILCNKEGTEAIPDGYATAMEFICPLYSRFLRRLPKAEELNNWQMKLLSHTVSGQIAVETFVHSEEFREHPLSDEEYITVLYETVMGREPDADELASWKAVLDSGFTRDKVMAGILNSDEMVSICLTYNFLREKYVSTEYVDLFPQTTRFVVRLYENCLGRKYDAKGLSAWVTALADGKATGSRVARNFFLSQEMKNKNLSDEEFVRTAYVTLLNREPDAKGLAAWVKALAETGDREKIVKGFTGSDEFGNLCSRYGIMR